LAEEDIGGVGDIYGQFAPDRVCGNEGNGDQSLKPPGLESRMFDEAYYSSVKAVLHVFMLLYMVLV
jgi:hypothetical protein